MKPNNLWFIQIKYNYKILAWLGLEIHNCSKNKRNSTMFKHRVTILSLFSRHKELLQQIYYHMMEILGHPLYQFLFLFFFCDACAHDVYAVDGPASQRGRELQYTQLCGLSRKFKRKQLNKKIYLLPKFSIVVKKQGVWRSKTTIKKSRKTLQNYLYLTSVTICFLSFPTVKKLTPYSPYWGNE